MDPVKGVVSSAVAVGSPFASAFFAAALFFNQDPNIIQVDRNIIDSNR